ncbi:MAG: nucleoside deaminase [bacterium]|nr:nucleoside deaminase [bacterium]
MNRAEPIAADVRTQLMALRAEVGGHRDREPHDRYSRIAIGQAIEGGLEGNAAIGALIVDPDGEVILSERNRMFVPRFRSDFHAEMVLLTRYENEHGNEADLRGHTLVSSLEPCEMCTIRIINSGVTNTLFVASDLGKGGMTGPNTLAAHWARLAEPQTFATADCSPRLAEIALEVFQATIGGVVKKMMARRLPG